jgi:hypothetical protein
VDRVVGEAAEEPSQQVQRSLRDPVSAADDRIVRGLHLGIFGEHPQGGAEIAAVDQPVGLLDGVRRRSEPV